MLKLSKNDLILTTLVLFVVCASLLGTGQIENEGHILKKYVLPSFVGDSALLLYFGLIGFFTILGFLHFCKDFKIYKPMLMLFISYLILFFWSVVTNSDQLRYLIILLSIFLCPIGIFYNIKKINFKRLAKSTVFSLSILIFFSVLYSYLNLPELSRVSGIHNNPNLMGMWLVSSLAVILYFSEYINKKIILFLVFLIMILVLFSGSRLAFIVLLILLIPFIFKYKFSALIIFFIGILYLVSTGDETSFRAVEVGSAVSDSGRENIWERAIQCIHLDPLVGHGMSGPQTCVEKPNIHNSYLRLAVMLGIPLTLIFYLSFFSFLAKSMFMKVNPFIKLYLVGIPLMFFAEDYVSGFASPFFPFLVFILALFLFDLHKLSKLRNGVSSL